jgi:predicted glycosyltransferase involved in capsule biosynthesis
MTKSKREKLGTIVPYRIRQEAMALLIHQKKGKDNYSMRMKMNKNYIEKMMYTHFNQKTKFIQIPRQHDIKFLNTLCKLSHYQ